jgi:NADPH-dependent 2,4-dienoyl-CoA reductase/sulfur reductase-like enzyme
MKSRYSLAIIGAGPAGMSAAITAAQHNLDVVVLDQQPTPGGQIYRALEQSPLPDKKVLGGDHQHGTELIAQFRAASVDYLSNASVWNIDTNSDGSRELGVLIEGNNRFIHADRLLIATGTQERPMPFPGWQLPGVMTAGAGQILLKSAAVVPRDGVVLAGNGPLLLLLACQYLRTGVKIRALLDTTPSGSLLNALPHLPRALAAYDYLLKGVSMMATIRRARVPVHKRVTSLVAEGDGVLQRVKFESCGKTQQLDTATLLVHQGIIPATELPQLANCALEWNTQQLCWQPRTDNWGGSSEAGVSIIGDGSGIAGAQAATLQGRIATLQCACTLAAISPHQRDKLATPLRKSLNRHEAIRPFLDTLYRPAKQFTQPPEDTIVCRCEEITSDEIRRVAQIGCPGPNQAKAFTRCGMGPCQGRQCGNSVAALIADTHQVPIESVGYYRARPPASPITLGQLAETSS